MAELFDITRIEKALETAYNWQSSQLDRKAATEFLEQLKCGSAQALAQIALALVSQEKQAYFRIYGYQVLQHILRNKWAELTAAEHQQLASRAFDMLIANANCRDESMLKGRPALFLAEVVRQEGPEMWKALLPALLSSASASPSHAEGAALVIQYLAEDTTIHNEDLAAEQRRKMLLGLTQSLPDILPFLYKLLESSFSAAVTEAQNGNIKSAQSHVAVVATALSAAGAYADWAPVTSLASSGLINASAQLLEAAEFRLSACEFLGKIVSRKKGTEENDSFEGASVIAFDSLLRACTGALAQISGQNLPIEDAGLEFAERLCKALVDMPLQSMKMATLSDKGRLNLYLQVMLEFFRQRVFRLHYRVTSQWLAVLRDVSAASHVHSGDQVSHGGAQAGDAGIGSSKKGKGKKSLVPDTVLVIPADCISALLDVVLEKWQHKEQAEQELQTDSATHHDFSQYISWMKEILKHLTSFQPALAATKIVSILAAALKAADTRPVTPEVLMEVEAAQSLEEVMVLAIPSELLAAAAASSRGPSSSPTELSTLFEGMSARLLEIQWQDPSLVGVLALMLGALGPYCRHSPPALPHILSKLLSLLTIVQTNKQAGLSGKQARAARMDVCHAFISLARTGDRALVPHLQVLAEQLQEMQQKQMLQHGEMNQLGEALMIVGAAGGRQQQDQVVEFLLKPVQHQWVDPEWQRQALASPQAFVLFMVNAYEGTPSALNKSLWSIYYAVSLFERIVRRIEGGGLDGAASGDKGSHLVAPHISWILPPLLQLLRCIHSLWSPTVRSSLPPLVEASMAMGPSEKAAHVGDEARRGVAYGDGAGGLTDGAAANLAPAASPHENLCSWLKGVRDCGYPVLGMCGTRIGDEFFLESSTEMAAAFCGALLENLAAMEMRHIKQMLHSVVIPLAKSCPAAAWQPWMTSLLPPVFMQANSMLTAAWTRLLQGGQSAEKGVVVKDEVLEEKLLRDFTREVCSLLAVLPTLPLISVVPTGPPGQAVGPVQSQGIKVTDAPGPAVQIQNSLLHFVLLQLGGDAPMAMLQIASSALTWPDTESSQKALAFCSGVASLPVASFIQQGQLCHMLGQEIFSSAIRGLTLESNSYLQADMCGFLRDVYLKLGNFHPGPKEVLLSLPSISASILASFEASLLSISSAKEQRQLVKQLLLEAGRDHLKALAPLKSSVIHSVTVADKTPSLTATLSFQDSDHIGLAAFGQ